MSAKKTYLSNPSLRASIWDAVFFSIMFGFGESYLGAYGVHLGLGPTHIGILASLPLLLGALSQVWAVKLVEQGISRRKLLVRCVGLQAFVHIPIALLVIFHVREHNAAFFLITLACLYYVFGHMAMPVWVSLLGDIVPPELKGRYFGKRNQIAGVALLTSVIVAGFILQASDAESYLNKAYVFIFLVAGISRIVSAFALCKHEDIPFVSKPEDHFTFFDFIRRIPNSNFATYAVFFALMNFSVFIAAPYFVVFMLKELQMSYAEFTIVRALGMGTSFMMMHFWGSISDRFGNKFIFNVCALGLCLAPILWIFSDGFFYLCFVNCFGGFFWAGFNLAAGNFLLDAVSPAKRGRCNAYLWICNASCIVLGSFLGGLLLEAFSDNRLPKLSLNLLHSPYLAVFVMSGILRLFVSIVMLPKFKEVREVEKFSHKQVLFRISRTESFSGFGFGYASGLLRNRKRTFDRNSFIKKINTRSKDNKLKTQEQHEEKKGAPELNTRQ